MAIIESKMKRHYETKHRGYTINIPQHWQDWHYFNTQKTEEQTTHCACCFISFTLCLTANSVSLNNKLPINGESRKFPLHKSTAYTKNSLQNNKQYAAIFINQSKVYQSTKSGSSICQTSGYRMHTVYGHHRVQRKIRFFK